MITVKKTHPTLYWSIVAIALFDTAVGLTLLSLPDAYFSATRGPEVITGSTNLIFGLAIALPGALILPRLFQRGSYSTVQKLLILDMSVWVFFSLASFGTVVLGNLNGIIGGLISLYLAFHRYNIISEPPVNPAKVIGNELREERDAETTKRSTRVRGDDV